MLLWIAFGAVAGWVAARHLAVGGLGICLATTIVLPFALFLMLDRIDFTTVVDFVVFTVLVEVSYFVTHLIADARMESRKAVQHRLGTA